RERDPAPVLPHIPYIGRFAPSPTGDLHLGSLLAAVGSYLDARHCGGRWLVRMEDLDSPRVVPGSAARIATPRYLAALARLKTKGHTFECSCSRSDLAGNEDPGYPGTCRDGPTRHGV